jgi:signal transduction histidine kinase
LELLDFRKQEQGHFKLKISQVNFVDFLKVVFITFREYALNNNITFNFNRISDNITLWIDVEQMQKVINNLLSNAFKFTPNGGSITITIEENDKDVVFAVNDTGQGILPDKIEYIFERFYQADPMGGYPNGIGLAFIQRNY